MVYGVSGKRRRLWVVFRGMWDVGCGCGCMKEERRDIPIHALPWHGAKSKKKKRERKRRVERRELSTIQHDATKHQQTTSNTDNIKEKRRHREKGESSSRKDEREDRMREA